MTNPGSTVAPAVPTSPTDALLETQAMLAAIGRIQAQLLTRKDAQAAFDALLAELLRASGSGYGFIGEVHHDGEGAPWLHIHAISDVAWSDETRALVQRAHGRGLEFRRLDTLIGAVLTGASVVISNAPATDSRSGGVPDGHPPLDAFLGMPFLHGERLIGVVGLANRRGGYDEAVVDTLQPVLDTVRTVLVAYRAERSRARAEAAAVRLNRRLEASVAELERINRVNRTLSDMRDRLQSCQSIAGICEVAEACAGALLGAVGGSVQLRGADAGHLRGRPARAGGEAGDEAHRGAEGAWDADAPHAVHCWGAQPPWPDAPARAASASAVSLDGARLRAPLVAQGEQLGLLQLELGEARPAEADCLTLAGNLAMHLSLAISNLRMRETLRAQAIRDPLTGLFNRRHMDEVMDREVRRAERHGGTLAVFMVDIDHFKRINDGFGHEAGDLVIRELAQCLVDAIRREDYAFRYGGEEFLLLLPHVEGGAMLARAESLLEAVRQLRPAWQGRPLGTVTVSIGAAAYPAHGRSPADLVRAADEAMYRAKQAGRDRAACAGAPSADGLPPAADPGFFALV